LQKYNRNFLFNEQVIFQDSDGNGFSDFEIRSQLDTFLFGGHDTTACAISWILYHLSTHPEYQEKCAVEIDAVMGDETDVSWYDVLT